MIPRYAWLAGSLPGATPTQAMQLALDWLGPCLLALPGGETQRPHWAASIIPELADGPLFETAKHGNWLDYDDVPRLTPTGDLDKLDLGYQRIYAEERPIADELIRAERRALSFQVDIPSPWDLSFFTVGPMRAGKYYTPFEAATLRDVMSIYTSDETVLFQISAPVEVITTLMVPGMARRLVMRKMVRKITDFVSRCPQGIRIGVHLCLGDLQHRAKGQLPQLAPLVDFVNELVDTWPRGYTLAFVTLPLAEGATPPVTEPSWYTDLARLGVPAGVRIVMGLCHESVTTDQIQPIIAMADSLTHQRVVVGASCGLALRGDPAWGPSRTSIDVFTILRQQRQLCGLPPIPPHVAEVRGEDN